MVHAEATEDSLTLAGPKGSATLTLSSSREQEGEGDRDRVSLELTTPVEEDGEEYQRIVFYLYVHDSYDGEHQLVVEDSVVCAPLLAQVAATIGAELTPVDLVKHARAALPAFAEELDFALERLDELNHTDDLMGSNF